MPLFIRIGHNVLHIPSLANVTMGRNWVGQPVLGFHYHNQNTATISYGWGKWEDCEKDMIRIKHAMAEVERTLSCISLTEPALTNIFEIPRPADATT